VDDQFIFAFCLWIKAHHIPKYIGAGPIFFAFMYETGLDVLRLEKKPVGCEFR
jgi:hypothetical protein